MFRKYDHLERYGHPEVEGLEMGTVWVFPKLDGTNASVWFEWEGKFDAEMLGYRNRQEICAGSRTRQLGHVDGELRDNHGFYAWTQENAAKFLDIFQSHPTWILYGEWLVPHTLKTYREDAWRRFFVFDVWCREDEKYVDYDYYHPFLSEHGIDLIHPMCSIANPSEDQLRREVENNTYLIRDGAGAGEGIVLKNYAWVNKFGRQPWAKIVRNEFKEENKRAFGVPEKHGEFQIESAIAEEFVTGALLDKERAKLRLLISTEKNVPVDEVEMTCRAMFIPRLLGTIYHTLVTEEIWTIVKKWKDPTIDFKKLRRYVTAQTKKFAGELF